MYILINRLDVIKHEMIHNIKSDSFAGRAYDLFIYTYMNTIVIFDKLIN